MCATMAAYFSPEGFLNLRPWNRSACEAPELLKAAQIASKSEIKASHDQLEEPYQSLSIFLYGIVTGPYLDAPRLMQQTHC